MHKLGFKLGLLRPERTPRARYISLESTIEQSVFNTLRLR